VNGNYDCKYFEDKGQLYLVYVQNLKNKLRNGIVIQPMLSPTELAPVAPTLLLEPSEKDGGFNSEWYANTDFKLVEVANLKFINNKYALAYSTGAFETAGYKAGVAWSDTLLPEPGNTYRKVLMEVLKGFGDNRTTSRSAIYCSRRKSTGRTTVATRYSDRGSPLSIRAPMGRGTFSSADSIRKMRRQSAAVRFKQTTADPISYD
jgi:hypothetical protein